MATKQETNVCIQNKTSRELLFVFVEHKIGSNPMEVLEWDAVWEDMNDIEKIDPDRKVHYETGIATGNDVWRITFLSTDGMLYSTDKELLDRIGCYFGITNNNRALTPGLIFTEKWLDMEQKRSIALRELGRVIHIFLTARETIYSSIGKNEEFVEYILHEKDKERPLVVTLQSEKINFSSVSGDKSYSLLNKDIIPYITI